MKRIRELDSLRGLAAIVVVLSHFMGAYYVNIQDTRNMEFWGNFYKYTPLHIFWAGHEAVILFFMLSGFVIAMPFLKKGYMFSFKKYLVKRILRIYPVVLVSLFVGLILMSILPNNLPLLNNEWLNSKWTEPETPIGFLNSTLIIANSNFNINSAMWSLTHIVRISILLPFFIKPILNTDWKKSLSYTIIISMIAYLGMVINSSDIIASVFYSSFFVVGALLAINIVNINVLYNSLQKWQKISLLVLASFMSTIRWWLPFELPIGNTFIYEWGTTIGMSIFITISTSSSMAANILGNKYLLFFGEISYSLYLYHFIFLIFFMKLLGGIVPTITILLLVFVVSVFFSWISSRYIESFSKLLENKYLRIVAPSKTV